VKYKEILERLAEATDQELAAALAEIQAASGSYTGAPTAESVAALRSLADAAQAITAQRETNAGLANEQAAALAQLSQLTEQPAEPETPEVPEQQPTEQPAAPEVPEQPAAPAPEQTPAAEPSAVTAGARRPLGGVGFGTQQPPAADVTLRLRGTVVPGPDATVRTFSTDRREAREEIARQFAAMAGRGRSDVGNGRVTLLTRRWEYPEERTLRRAGGFANLEKLDVAQDDVRSRNAQQNALVAAGICGPVTIDYDIPVIGDTDTPVRDALVPFGAERGGITFRPPIDGVLQTGGIGVWTPANDTADPLVPKTCFEVECPDPDTFYVDAIYQCLQFSNMSSQFDPENMDAAIRSAEVFGARFRENRLIGQLIAGSKNTFTTRVLGAARDMFANLDKLIAYYRNVHRLNSNAPLRFILPQWCLDMIRADITRQMVGDGLDSLGVADEVIMDWFRRRNINVTWHMDGIDPADLTVPEPDIVVPAQFYSPLVTGSEVPGFPDAVSGILFREGDWIYMDGGELNMGIVRDSTLNSLNRFQTFSEDFGNPVNRGIESLHVVMRLQPTGQSAATKDTNALVD
jgi:hypothetical protein